MDALTRSADATRFATWPRTLSRLAEEEAKKSGRSAWLVRVWDAATGKQLGSPIELGRRPLWGGVALSPDGKRVAAVFHTAAPPKKGEEFDDVDPMEPGVFVVRVWDADTGKRIGPDMTTVREKESQGGVQFAAGGRLVVATSRSWMGIVTQTVFDIDTGKPLELPEPARAVYGRPDDPFVVTTNAATEQQSRMAHLRDARTLATIGRRFNVSEVRTAAVAADGSRVVLGNSYWLGAGTRRPASGHIHASGSTAGRHA